MQANRPFECFSTTSVNLGWEAEKYLMNKQEKAAFDDAIAFYGPHQLVRKVASYFGCISAVPGYVGNGSYYDIDTCMRLITGKSGFSSSLKRNLFGGGKGHDLHGMFVSTLGELIERIVGVYGAIDIMSELPSGSYKDLTAQGYPCIAPEELPIFAPEQHEEPGFAFSKFDENSHVRWIEGKRLLSGEPVMLPAQLILMYYIHEGEEDWIGYATSGGLASHISREEALYHGVTELFERDAVNLRWYCRAPLEEIDLDCDITNPRLAQVINSARDSAASVKFYLHDVGFPEIPVVTAVEMSEQFNRYAYLAGGGVGLEIEESLLGAFSEFVQSERNLRNTLYAPSTGFAQGIEGLFSVDEDQAPEEIDLFYKIISHYGHKAHRDRTSWYFQNGHPRKLSSLKTHDSTDAVSKYGKFTVLRDVLKQYSLDPIVFDFTSRDMESLRLTKVFMPELCAPFLAAKPFFGNPRYADTLYKTGALSEPVNYDMLVSNPLPYP